MKKTALLTVSALLAAAPVFASDVEGSNVFGLLTVLSKAPKTIVAVPWCECSTADDQPIAISNIVKTANLTVGDVVSALDEKGDVLRTWTLASGAGDVKYWAAPVDVIESGNPMAGITADKAHAARGAAILLHRANPTNSVGAANAFYLYGQVGTLSEVSSTIYNTGASSSTPVYTLIAPPTDADADLLAALSNPVVGDSVVTRSLAGVNKTYTYKESGASGAGWYASANPTVEPTKVDSITISAGTGAWYVSRSSSAKPTITWSGVPHK